MAYEALAKDLYQEGAVLIGRFPDSRVKFNFHPDANPRLLERIGLRMLATVNSLRVFYTHLISPPGKEFLALAVSQVSKLSRKPSVLAVRGDKVLGKYKPGATGLLILDQIKDGMSELNLMYLLAEKGIFLDNILAIIDAEKEGTEKLSDLANVFALFTKSELVQYIIQDEIQRKRMSPDLGHEVLRSIR